MSDYKKFENIEELESAIEAYFKDCDERKKPYTIEGLCCALDMDRRTLLNYEKAKGYEKSFHTIERAKRRIAKNKVEGATDSTYNANFVKFDLINNHGYKDKTTHEIDPENNKLELVVKHDR